MEIAYYLHYVGHEFVIRSGICKRNGGSCNVRAEHQISIYCPGLSFVAYKNNISI